MTTFCDGCPMRGAAKGELIGTVETGEVTVRKLGMVRNLGSFGAMVDENRDISKVMHFPKQVNSDAFMEGAFEKIDRCAAPATKEVGVIRRHTVVIGCPALGALAINPDSPTELQVGRQLRPDLQAIALSEYEAEI